MEIESILIISDDDRVKQLVDHFQPLLLVKLSLVPDFSHGFKQVLEARPAAVFIQRRISGVLGETVASQLKVLLRDGIPRLVLLNESPGTAKASASVFDDKIDLFLDEVELQRQFTYQLEKLPSVQWRNRLDEVVVPDFNEPFSFSIEDELVSLTAGDVVPDGAEQAVTADPEPTQLTVPVESTVPYEPSSAPVVTDTAVLWSNEEKQLCDDFDVVAPEPDAVVPPPNNNVIGSNLRTPADDTPPPSNYFWLKPVAIAFIVLAAFVWIKRSQLLKSTAFQTVSAKLGKMLSRTETKGQTVVLPAMIPIANVDIEYSAAHPGWERYLSGDTEFLVFRELDAIKALQVISRDETGLKEADIAFLLKDMTGKSSYTIKTHKEQDGYLLEAGVTSAKGEILLYRNKQSGVIRALVVTL